MSERAELNRRYLLDKIEAVPFQKFTVGLESGDRYEVRHPASISFEPEAGGGSYVFLAVQKWYVQTSLDAITGIAFIDEERPPESKVA